MTALLALVGKLCALFACVVWDGYVLSIIWGWFVVPIFAAPALNVPQAIGLSIVAAMLTHQIQEREKKDFAWWLAHAALLPAFILFASWVVYQWL